jgi:hypothetical protein
LLISPLFVKFGIMLRSLLLIIFLFLRIGAFSQNTFSISGTVRDKTETLPGAGIYVGGYQIATVTNNEGKFIISNLKPGSYDILVQMIGYTPLSKNIVITDKSIVVDLKIVESAVLLKEVVIKPDPDRDYYINFFKQYFIGKTPNAEQCKIMNTNVLLIDADKRAKTVTIKASDFLVIENQALGYRIKYLLELFEYNYNTRILFYAGYPTFEEMKGSKAKQKKWIKNREIAYRGSSLHFLKALYLNKVYEEGFIINKRYQVPNPNRLPDSVIDANVSRLMHGKLDSNENKTTLSGWVKKKREPKTFAFIDRNNVIPDTLAKKFNDNLKIMNFKDELFIIYKNEQETPSFKETSDYLSRPKDLENYQVSIVKMLIAPIHFYANGITYNPRSTLYSGFWSYEKMADAVPIDYVPLKK